MSQVASARGLTRFLAARQLRSDRFGTIAAILGVALGVATVNAVVVLDESTSRVEAGNWETNPRLAADLSTTVNLRGLDKDGKPKAALDVAEETHEDYQVMRSAIRMGSLSAFLVGALIVFFTFTVIVERRKRELALLCSLGATRKQIARIVALQALIVGAAGALLGFVLAVPLAKLAARAGITTTGRSVIQHVYYPWSTMALVSLVGGLSALLGVIKPLRSLWRMQVAGELARQAEEPAPARQRHLVLVALPFMALVYVLMRPFFRETLPSLAFFAVEAGLCCAAFLATVILTPTLVRRLGALLGRLLLRGPAAERLLTLRRIERRGDQLAWSVSGVMVVFALLLALHIVTLALRVEVQRWAAKAVRPYAYLYMRDGSKPLPLDQLDVASVPDGVVRLMLSGATLWPNHVRAAKHDELVAFARASGRAQLVDIAQRLGRGKILLSPLLARRLGVKVGEKVEVSRSGNTRRVLEVVAITDELGYARQAGPYRQSKNFALIDDADFDLIAPYVARGASAVFADGRPAARALHGASPQRWGKHYEHLFAAVAWRADDMWRAELEIGASFELSRMRETDRDFAIFDLILLLTALLAAVGIANQLVLSFHARERELGVYRVLGMTRKQIERLALMEGAFVGLLGGALAAALGAPLGYAAIGALQVISAFEVHYALPWYYPLLTVVGALAIAIGAALYPARRAAQTDFARALHYE
ncbi:MAG: ABC transporter permease [Myxococcales bacterium]|nr:ABC transporter permease [Myxococcales bacterium]